MAKIIFNADDFGLTHGVNTGIIEAYNNGVVRSTTLMVTMPYAEEAVKLAARCKGLGVGVHLTGTIGKPLMDNMTSLIDSEGYFHKVNKVFRGEVSYNLDELYTEWKAQIEKFISLVGRKPTHIDSHHHVHLHPNHVKVALRLADEYKVPMRGKGIKDKSVKTVNLVENFYETNVTYEFFNEDIKSKVQSEVADVMCHPAIADEELKKVSSYSINREEELRILTSEKLKSWLKENNIEVINYNTI